MKPDLTAKTIVEIAKKIKNQSEKDFFIIEGMMLQYLKKRRGA